MHCPHCGKSIQEGSKACEYCGKKIEAGEVSQQESKKESASSPSQKGGKMESGRASKNASSSRSPDSSEKNKKDSRGEEGKTQEKGEAPPEEEVKKKKMSWATLSIFGVLGLLLAFLYFYSDRAPPPPPPSTKGTFSGSEQFYTALGEAIQETGVAKRYFNEAQAFLPLGGESQPAAMTQPAESGPAPQLLKAVEKFASALERFKFAQQVVNNAKLQPNDDLQVCQKAFIQILDRYVSATQTFKENAETVSKWKVDKDVQTSGADAKAQYEMANQMMGKFLADGCKADYFKFIATRNPVDKGVVFKAYQMVLLENFEPQRPVFETLFQYKPAPESSPSESGPAKP